MVFRLLENLQSVIRRERNKRFLIFLKPSGNTYSRGGVPQSLDYKPLHEAVMGRFYDVRSGGPRHLAVVLVTCAH